MTPTEYALAAYALKAQYQAGIAQLNEALLASRLYPDGFVVQMVRRHKGEDITVSGPIRSAEVTQGKTAEILYSLKITHPVDYNNSTTHPVIPAGKWEIVLERQLTPLLSGIALADMQRLRVGVNHPCGVGCLWPQWLPDGRVILSGGEEYKPEPTIAR